jgi:hypothetical protein
VPVTSGFGSASAAIVSESGKTRRTRTVDTEQLRAASRQIDQPRADERSAVVDPHDQLAAVLEIADLDVARQRQCLMRRGQPVLIIGFAVGG